MSNLGIPVCIQLKTFYDGLVPSSRNILDASYGGALLSKSYNEGFKLIESITTNTYQWPTARANSAPTKKIVGVHEVSETTALSAQIAQLGNMMKTFMTTPVKTLEPEPIKVVTDSAEVARVYCGGGYLFEDCLGNPVSINYILAQGVSIKNLENQIGQIATALSSRTIGALPSSTETPASTSNDKGKKICKVIFELSSGREYERPNVGDIVIDNTLKGTTEEHTVSEPSQSLSPTTEESPEAVQKPKSDKSSIDTEVPKPSSQGVMKQFDNFFEMMNINLMPLSVFKNLGIGAARQTTITLQLADRNICYPRDTPILLGRPFLATGRTLIDVEKGELTMRVNTQEVTFNVLKAMKYPKVYV
ncbi:hypothetical protein L195_g012957 [Trifolium pratense]|uniref:Uncharacterized protein n=1 Tax=Trifolium pratense TaxID=57577 RepID=A0A2K3PLT3_TRIPR|nr:hypothetical protein L195_g012957 [Trifolium pratense]